jgi:hypothetical protein
MVQLLILTGCRYGEVAALRWSFIGDTGNLPMSDIGKLLCLELRQKVPVECALNLRLRSRFERRHVYLVKGVEGFGKTNALALLLGAAQENERLLPRIRKRRIGKLAQHLQLALAPEHHDPALRPTIYPQAETARLRVPHFELLAGLGLERSHRDVGEQSAQSQSPFSLRNHARRGVHLCETM